MTVEFVTEPTFDGGLANYLYKVGRSLLQLGHRPVVIVPAKADETLVHDGIEVHRVGIPRNAAVDFLDRVTGRRLSVALSWAWQSWRLNRALSTAAVLLLPEELP